MTSNSVHSVPPPYSAASDGSSSNSDSTTHRLPDGVKPCNFVQISRSSPITGIWVIDPLKRVPEVPDNLKLECTSSWKANSSIFADVFVLPSSGKEDVPAPKSGNTEGSGEPKRTNIALEAAGWIKLRLVRPLDPNPARVQAKMYHKHDASPHARKEDRLPITVRVKSGHNVKLYLPRSFCGPLHLKAQWRVWYSPAVTAQLTPLSEKNGDHMAFLGSMDSTIWDGWKKWKGDFLDCDAGRAAIDVYFDDEDYIPTTDNNCVCM
ncbi:hypothetical protein CPB83DRAFT_897057 [Crepidotus variabilis]|uniref:DUF7330 domain-containing protein n=1 Tax=Crepidotus variabilis TaxID=179855 RepID=A0A9P6E9X2_9AGAR|nr:hypothetical protein CPB83DRAFT_897057 [Crepidotus variabilis]